MARAEVDGIRIDRAGLWSFRNVFGFPFRESECPRRGTVRAEWAQEMEKKKVERAAGPTPGHGFWASRCTSPLTEITILLVELEFERESDG